MATQSLDVIRRVVMEAQSKGFDKLAADLDKVAKSQEGVAGSSTTVTKSQGSVDAAFARTERTLDKTMVAYQAFAKQVQATNNALEQGRTSPERAAQLIGLADAQLQKATGSTAQFTQSTGLARHELINLGRQMQDVVVSLGSGQGFGTVLLQQGAQVFDVFASMRSTVGAALTQLGGMAVRVAPVAAALGAVATAIYAVNKAASESREARIATTSGLGRLSDVSADQIAGLAERGRTPGMSLGEAREGVIAFTKAGADATTITEGLAVATRLATTRGIELSDAYKIIAEIIRDPAAAAQKYGAELRILSDEQQKNIARMQANGDRAGAFTAVMKGVTGTLVSAKDATTTWTQALADAWTGLDRILKLDLSKVQTFAPPKLEGFPGTAQPQPPGRGLGIAIPGARQQGPDAGLFPDREGLANAQEMQAQAEAMVRADKAITAELEKQAFLRDRINAIVGDAKEKLEDQLRIAQAFTTEQKAAAAEIQKRNELENVKGPGRLPDEAIAGVSKLAGAGVKGAAAAEAQQALAVQQQQLGMYQQLAAAAQMQGMAGVVLNAQLQMELQLRQQGLNVLLPENQARIQNAGVLAQQAVALRDLAQAQEMRAAGADQVAMMQLENSLIGEDAAVRAQLTAVMQGEIEARALERQGMEASAAASRQVAAAKGEEAARSQEIQAQLQAETAARQAAAQAAQQQASAQPAGPSPYASSYMSELQRVGPTWVGAWRLDELKQMSSANSTPRPGQAMGAGNSLTMGLVDGQQLAKWAKMYGEGNFSVAMAGGLDAVTMRGKMEGLPVADMAKINAMRDQAQAQLKGNAQQALQTRLNITMSSLSKHIADLNETVGKSAELQQKLDAEESKRQQRQHNYLAAGPSPYEQNADIYYDPKKRLLFAEQIAGNTNDLLKQQVAAAKADEAAAKAQIKALEDQQQKLQDQSELLAAGVDLSKEELAAMEMLIGAVRNELPANLATAFDRMQQANAERTQKAAEDLKKGLPLAVSSGLGSGTQSGAWSAFGYNAVPGSGGGAYTGGAGGLAGGGSLLGGSGTTTRTGAALGGFASGGAFTVPGSGASDRPFRIGLTPGERVSITPPGKKAAGGTTVERMIIQLPPGAEPIALLNKTSRNSLSRAARRTGRMM